ncbi:TetR/AcrR family transcriptional regulator [Rhodoflexus caldus]|uniref:TetR/AcrR family transcriptional regulator n=1 Tax=Rhodoflexus caldus TaxID=2891236 RepID=UPI00202A697B|nr:TetR/AcrR family transcriptional regulator [Rhodoflexus caldus]
MNTRELIVQTADGFIRDKGFNAFSYKDISAVIGIKTSSIHYYFPTKTLLAVAVVQEHMRRLEQLIHQLAGKPALEQLDAFTKVYKWYQSAGQVCVIGSLATDLHTVEEPVKVALQQLTDRTLNWLTEVLAQGRENGEIVFDMPPRSKALLIITNLLAALQLVRLTGEQDFDLICQSILNDLTIHP